MNNRFGILLIIIIMALMLSSCNSSIRQKPIETQGLHMGTIITQKVYGENAKKAADEVTAKMADIEAKMTINAPGGDANKLNEMAGVDKVKLDPETIYVLETAKRFSKLSAGSFDVTVGPLVKAWGIFTDHPRIPNQEELNNLLKYVDYNGISIDSKEFTAKILRQGQLVDLGGIAKGYAGDAAIDIYKKNNIKSAFVNLGGNVVVLGSKPDGRPWSIGVQNPRAESGIYIGILKVKDKAIVSSGDYERYFEKDGKRYHHILDPKTGYPSNSDLIGTTIVADRSIEADALSTAVFVLGLEKGMELIKNLSGIEAVFITKDKKVYTTPGLKDVFIFEDESKEYQYVEKR